MTDYGQTAEVTEEERKLILRNAASGVRNVPDYDSIQRRKDRFAAEDAVYLKQRQEYQDKVQSALELKEKQEQIRFENVTQGRHKNLGDKQVLFTQEQDCPYSCGETVKYVLDGWNGNKNIMHLNDPSIPYDPLYVDENKNHSKRHQCHASDMEKMMTIMDEKVAELNKKIKANQAWNLSHFRQVPFL
jgi:hypothetical protein